MVYLLRWTGDGEQQYIGSMHLLTGKHAATRIAGLINPKYQVHGYSVDLTARNIYWVDPVGQIDFGGSEYAPAGKLAVVSRRRRPEDRYEWWDLGRGSYFVELNESLELGEDEIALLEPEERLLRVGAVHVPVFLRGNIAPLEVLLNVETMRVQIKQNARLSRVRLFRFVDSKENFFAVGDLATHKLRKALASRSPVVR